LFSRHPRAGRECPRRLKPSNPDCPTRETKNERTLYVVAKPEGCGRIRHVDIVEFLEARVSEDEAELRHASADDPSTSSDLASGLLAECAQKRAIIADWKRAVSEGPEDNPEGELAVARRSMLSILAAGYVNHPDFDPEWGAPLD
jgi:hypothetical protein